MRKINNKMKKKKKINNDDYIVININILEIGLYKCILTKLIRLILISSNEFFSIILKKK